MYLSGTVGVWERESGRPSHFSPFLSKLLLHFIYKIRACFYSARASDPIPPSDPHPDPPATRPTCFSTGFVDFTGEFWSFFQPVSFNFSNRSSPFSGVRLCLPLSVVSRHAGSSVHQRFPICPPATSNFGPNEIQFLHWRPSIQVQAGISSSIVRSLPALHSPAQFNLDSSRSTLRSVPSALRVYICIESFQICLRFA